MSFLQQSDEELLRAVAAGSEEAFTCLYRRHQGRVYRFALQMSGSAQKAEEVVQEVFLALLDGGGGFDAAKGSLSGYLLGMARNQVLRALRSDAAFQPLEDDEGDGEAALATPENALADLTRLETVESVRQAVLALPANYREAIVLCELQEMEYLEAAKAMGCSIGTVRSRLHRARSLLVQKLRALRQSRGPYVRCGA